MICVFGVRAHLALIDDEHLFRTRYACWARRRLPSATLEVSSCPPAPTVTGAQRTSYSLTRDARPARHDGRECGITRLGEPRIRGTMDDAWGFTALAAQLSGAKGAYRGPAGGDRFACMAFDTPTVFRDSRQ